MDTDNKINAYMTTALQLNKQLTQSLTARTSSPTINQKQTPMKCHSVTFW